MKTNSLLRTGLPAVVIYFPNFLSLRCNLHNLLLDLSYSCSLFGSSVPNLRGNSSWISNYAHAYHKSTSVWFPVSTEAVQSAVSKSWARDPPYTLKWGAVIPWPAVSKRTREGIYCLGDDPALMILTVLCLCRSHCTRCMQHLGLVLVTVSSHSVLYSI